MSELTIQEKLIQKETLSVPIFGYNLIREDLLQDLLGKDTPELLYWAGKRIARKYPLNTSDEITAFFHQAGWGTLTIKSESKQEKLFELQSDVITERLNSYPDSTFHLEAGFLAQQTEHQKGVLSEAFEHPRKKGAKVQFTVKWDLKDKIED
ncbi:YslB family protein [Neobacillus sp. LXY-4]|uniref:YslB family protein n=1 Tax=Neobacillus sp. LXY-4 TaxID=3379826 RepID=UPI003EE04F2B